VTTNETAERLFDTENLREEVDDDDGTGMHGMYLRVSIGHGTRGQHDLQISWRDGISTRVKPTITPYQLEPIRSHCSYEHA
jgi:hypothetical protein